MELLMTSFFCGKRIKYITRLSGCSETSKNQQQGKEETLKGTHIFLSSRDTFLVANFRDYSHINNCSFPPKFGQDASTYTSITACISSFCYNRSDAICSMCAFIAGFETLSAKDNFYIAVRVTFSILVGFLTPKAKLYCPS